MFWFNIKKVFEKKNIKRAFAKCRRNSVKSINSTAIIFFDLDKMKNVNDDFSHMIGDKVINRYLEILKKAVREKDSLVRFGGDEVLIFMPNINSSDLDVKIAQIQEDCMTDEVFHSLISKGMSVSAGALMIDDPRVYDLDDVTDKVSRLTKKAKYIESHRCIQNIKNFNVEDIKKFEARRRTDGVGNLMRDLYNFTLNSMTRGTEYDVAMVNKHCRELWAREGAAIISKWTPLQIQNEIKLRYHKDLKENKC